MNPDLDRLQPYPFEKLRRLLDGVVPADLDPISLSVGEPRHPPFRGALEAFATTLDGFARYPSSRGDDPFRQSVGGWLARRHSLPAPDVLAERHVLPLNGTREGLFAIAQCIVDRTATGRDVLMPNPFYQIYEGAALLAGGHPAFYAISDDADADLEAIDATSWDRCCLVYVCSPGNPTGATLSSAALGRLIERAHRHDFVIVSDECYGEIYRESAGAPSGLLDAARQAGVDDYARCLSFHSLSKRSNLPGLRSGFVAGDAALIARFLAYRTYHGCSMGTPVQAASMAAWDDEAHVAANRAAYDSKYAAVAERLAPVLDVAIPPGGFYLWPQLHADDEAITRRLLAEANVRAVPGSYLARADAAGDTTGGKTVGRDLNPGAGHLRLALVASPEDCSAAASRIASVLQS